MTDPATETPPAASGRPEPVLGAATGASALTSLAGIVLLVLVFTHVITPGGQAVLGPALASAIPTVVGAVSTVVAAYRARAKVTPLSDPRNAAGERLLAARVLPSQQTPGPDHSA